MKKSKADRLHERITKLEKELQDTINVLSALADIVNQLVKPLDKAKKGKTNAKEK